MTRLYDRRFWLSYAAYGLLYVAHALMFRFAQFVTHLGGAEREAGQVVAVGLLAAIPARVILGRAIDRVGLRRVWIASTVLELAGLSWLARVHAVSPALYGARVVYAVGFAAMLACGLVAVQDRAPDARRTEAVGVLESSVFVGLIVGSIAGDRIFACAEIGVASERTFAACIALGLVYLALVLAITSGRHARSSPTPKGTPSAGTRWPWPVLGVAAALGTNFAVTTVFLAPYFATLGGVRLGTFFAAYCIFSFCLRLLTRRLHQTIGVRAVVLLGLLGMALGQLAFASIRAEWHVVLPAIGCGVGRALLYPALVVLGSSAFPPERRGAGTALTLAAIDAGLVASAPAFGALVDAYGYAAAFGASALAIAVAAAAYALANSAASSPDPESFPNR